MKITNADVLLSYGEGVNVFAKKFKNGKSVLMGIDVGKSIPVVPKPKATGIVVSEKTSPKYINFLKLVRKLATPQTAEEFDKKIDVLF